MLEKTKQFLLGRFPHTKYPRLARFIARLTWGTFILIVLIKVAQVITVTYIIRKY